MNKKEGMTIRNSRDIELSELGGEFSVQGEKNKLKFLSLAIS